MNIIHISTRDNLWGAAKAACRLHTGLLSSGVNSKVIVQESASSLNGIIPISSKIEGVYVKSIMYLEKLIFSTFYRHRQKTVFSSGLMPDRIIKRILSLDSKPDLIHVHWVGQAFMSLKTIEMIRCPVVITMHDSWSFTGGCHVPFECKKYLKKCSSCPQLGSPFGIDLSRFVFEKKKKVWSKRNLTFVAPSAWMKSCAQKSALQKNCRNEVIPNGIDEGVFDITKRRFAREAFGLRSDRKYVLFGANSALIDKNKGFALLKSALLEMKKKQQLDNTELLVFGCKNDETIFESDITVNNVGVLHDDCSLALLYAAADVMVVPSLLENFPNVILEALGCGTPVVAFNNGGIPEMIEHKICGYLAEAYSASDLARGIWWVLYNDNLENITKNSRRRVVDHYTLQKMVNNYMMLYKEVIGKISENSYC